LKSTVYAEFISEINTLKQGKGNVMALWRHVNFIAILWISVACGQDPTTGVSNLANSQGILDNRGKGQIFLDQSSTLASLSDDYSCDKNWASMLQDSLLDVRIVFGYGDDEVGGLTFDSIGHNDYVRHLTSDCNQSNYFACGFKRTSGQFGSQISVLEKKTTGKFGQNFTIQIQIMHSSLTGDHHINSKSRYSEQKVYSEKAKNFFYRGLRDADVVFYEGHARAGGGPDFFPAIMAGKGVNYAAYKGPNSSFNQMLKALRQPHRVKLLGLYGCDTRDLWQNSLQKAAPSLGFILTRNVDYKLKYQVSMMGALDSVLGQKCRSAFDQSLYAATQRKASMPADLTGFF
jgi:hypothetical protein